METIEEAAVIYTDENPFGNITWNNTSEIDRLKEKKYQGFIAGVEFAQRWISVEEELPQEGISVLIKNDFGYFGINVLENGIWRMCTVEKIAGLLNLKEYELKKFAMPTHWRPIELK